jgi:hypothetical protein
LEGPQPEGAPAHEPLPEDYEVARLWQVSVVAEEYGLSPVRAAWELDSDPEQLAIAILPLRRYAEAWNAWKRADADELKAWRKDPMMDRVNEIAGALAAEEIAADAADPEGVGA